MNKIKQSLFAASALLAMGSANAADLTVEITNITNGIVFTPPFVSAHTADAHIFRVGEEASAGLQLIAECGSSATLKTDLDAMGANTADAAGPVTPGSSVSIELTTSATNNRLSLATMLLPTNDAFSGLDSIEIPRRPGTYTYYADAYDAGTEANDEIVATEACAPGVPGFPLEFPGFKGTGGTGVAGADTNTWIHIHRGNLGDADLSGGMSDVDSTVQRWQNPVLKITVTVK